MSGGEFDYIQHRLPDVSEMIAEYLLEYATELSDETIDKFNLAIETVGRAAKMIERVDYLISCDDSEESFNERWGEEGLNNG